MTTTPPPMPEPCQSALVRGFEGSEYRPLSDEYEPQAARFSIAQIKARDAQWMERIERKDALLRQALGALTYQGTMGPTRRQRRHAAIDAIKEELQ